MTDREQNDVDWDDEEFLFAVEGLSEEEEGSDLDSVEDAWGDAEPPEEAGMTTFFGSSASRKGSGPSGPSLSEMMADAGLGGAGSSPEASLASHFEAEPDHPLARDEAWEPGFDEADGLEIRQAPVGEFDAGFSEDGSDGWGFDAEEEADVLGLDAEPVRSSIQHGFEASMSFDEYPVDERLRTDTLAEAVSGGTTGAEFGYESDLEDSAEDETSFAAGDEEGEVVSWAAGEEEGYGAHAEEPEGFADADFDDEPGYGTPRAVSSPDRYDAEGGFEGEETLGEYGESYGDLHENEVGSAGEPTAGRERSGRGRRLLLLGSFAAAAALLGLATPLVMEYLQPEEPTPAQPPRVAARVAASAAGAGGARTTPEVAVTADGTSTEDPGGASTAVEPEAGVSSEVEVGTDPNAGSELAAGDPEGLTEVPELSEGGLVGETVEGLEPGDLAAADGTGDHPLAIRTGEGETLPPAAELPPLLNLPSGEMGRIDVGESLALGEEFLPNSQGGLETSDDPSFGEDAIIPATAWTDMGGALPAGDTILRQSRVRLMLRNGNEFTGQLRKIDENAVEIGLEQGVVTFVYSDLRELVPLEAVSSRLSEFPEGFVEFKSQSRIWGRILSEMPNQVTLAFGSAQLTIPTRSIRRVVEQPLSTVIFGAAKG